MLSTELQATIQNSYNELESAGFKKRKPQMLLLGKLASAAAQGVPFISEAPTGIGKTLSYSLALIPIAQSLNEPLILSTATIALQNQLVDDLAMLQKTTSQKFSFAQAKGRNNFFCPSAADKSFEGDHFNSAYEEKKLRTICDEFDGSWNGDFEKLSGKSDLGVQKLCVSSSETCNRRTCPYSAKCPYYENIDAVRGADVVVSNHSLTTAMAEIGFGRYLREGDDDCAPLLVIDEGHHFHGIFRDAMSVCVNFESTSKKLKTNSRFDKELSAYNDISSNAKEAQTLANDINAILKTLSNETHQIAGDQKTARFKPEQLSEHYQLQLSELSTVNKRFSKELNAIAKFIEAKKDDLPANILNNLLVKSSVASNIADNISRMIFELNQDLPKATWFELQGNTYSINVCPLEVSELFNEKIIDQCHSITIVSATLRTNGNFDFITERLGLPDTTQYLLAPSPFDATRANLHTPNTGFAPNDPNHIIAVSKQATSLFKERQGSMVLLSSWTKLNAFKDNLPQDIKSKCLIQGELSRSEISSQHKKNIDNGKTSIIIGLQSFGEGIDMKGTYLSTIIIPQIPFMHVNDPISAAESEFFESTGQNAFIKVSLPDATVKLVQWCGRLLRSEDDSGDIYIFDNRLTTKGYGKGILATLPAYNRAS